MNEGNLLWVVVGMTVVTALPRIVPILLLSGRKMPPLVERWLALIAPAMLAALLAPELLLDRSGTEAVLFLSLKNYFLLAALPALFVAWRTKKLSATVLVGLVGVALLRWAFGG